MVRGVDEEEMHFLDEVSRKQELLEKERQEEEQKELNEFRISFTWPLTAMYKYSGLHQAPHQTLLMISPCDSPASGKLRPF